MQSQPETEAVADERRLAALRAFDILDTPPEPGFDDVVMLAAQVCGATTALVSLVDRDRQWFKARVNFEACQTPLSHSVCRHALSGRDVLVIPDLTLDPRTRDNPLVTREPLVRFYAGAPIVTDEGFVLGTVCVLDRASRPEGLTPAQTEGLRALARQVMQLLQARRRVAATAAVVAELAAAEAAVRSSEAKWRGLFENLREGFLLGRVLRDAAGHVVDWRYEEVNSAWYELMGFEPGSAVGRTVRDLLPGVEDEWIDEFASVVETGRPARFTRRVGPLDRWYDGYADAIGGDFFTVMFLEATQRIQRERRQAALVDLGDRLRDLSEVGAIAEAAAEVLATTLDATRAGFGTVDVEAETVLMHRNWCATGAAPVEGLHRFRDYGSFIDELKAGRTVIVDDVTQDPRTAPGAAALLGIGIRALLNLPVIEQGRFALVVFVHHDQPRALAAEDVEFIRQVGDRTEAAFGRLRAEQQQRLLNHELAHRMKNTLAMVQAIATQTLRQARSMQEGREAIGARLTALARAQDILTHTSWEEADVRDVVEAAIGPHQGEEGRISTDGPRMRLTSQQALGLSLAIHELATNAAKYGSLSVDTGRVDMRWSLAGGAFTFDWVESGGPAVAPPSSRGFGSKLIERIVAAYFNGEGHIDFAPDGIRFRLAGRP